MVAEYVAKKYPREQAMFRVRLGSIPTAITHEGMTEQELSLLRVWNRWADAVVIEGKTMHIIEAKIRPKLGPLEQLELYGRLLKNTPELSMYSDYTVQKHFVYAVEDPVLNVMARERGILAEQFIPSWLPDYLNLLSRRERRATIQEAFEEG